jgi:hypothetical protein
VIRNSQFPLHDRERSDRRGGGQGAAGQFADPMTFWCPRRQERRARLFEGSAEAGRINWGRHRHRLIWAEDVTLGK